MQVLDFLGALSPGEVDWLLAHAELRTVSPGDVLIREGETPQAIYFVADGMLDVLLAGASGQPVRIDRCAPGTIIGEMSWLDGRPASATISAAEASAILELPAVAINVKVRSDTAFAARLYRAIALIASERLRTAHARTRQSDESKAEGAVPARDPATARLVESIDALKDLLVAADRAGLEGGGKVPLAAQTPVRSHFRQLMQDLGETIGDRSTLPESVRNTLGATARRELVPLIQLTGTAERFYSKPRGHAGDYFTMELLYRNAPAGAGRIGPVLDACFLDQPSLRAARNCRQLLANEIAAACAAGAPGEVRVTSLACGPAAEVFDACGQIGRAAKLNATCVDTDRAALEFVRQRCAENQLPGRVSTLHANLIYMATGRQPLDLPAQDFIYSLSLIDDFSDEFVVQLMDWIFERLRPGGRVLLGSYHPRNPDKALMDYVLHWRLIHRDEAAMDRLFGRSKFGRECSRFLFEEEGIRLFAECVKP